eukprot:8145409-Pyramimonas_sp.AAC.1
MQLLRRPLLVLWIDVDQQVAPQVVLACDLQGPSDLDGPDESEDGEISVGGSVFGLGAALAAAPAGVHGPYRTGPLPGF